MASSKRKLDPRPDVTVTALVPPEGKDQPHQGAAAL